MKMVITNVFVSFYFLLKKKENKKKIEKVLKYCCLTT